MSYSATVVDNRPRVGALQQTRNACSAAATADAMGDLVGWDGATRLRAQQLLIRALGLTARPTTLAATAKAAGRLFGRQCTFHVVRADFDHVVSSTHLGIVIGLASQHTGQPGHAYHLIGGSFPLRDTSMPEFLRARQRALDDILEHITVWDPWDGSVQQARYADVRQRYEAAGGLALLAQRK
jgi:hypothetical protein